jgi:hypothetical protein
MVDGLQPPPYMEPGIVANPLGGLIVRNRLPAGTADTVNHDDFMKRRDTRVNQEPAISYG